MCQQQTKASRGGEGARSWLRGCWPGCHGFCANEPLSCREEEGKGRILSVRELPPYLSRVLRPSAQRMCQSKGPKSAGAGYFGKWCPCAAFWLRIGPGPARIEPRLECGCWKGEIYGRGRQGKDFGVSVGHLQSPDKPPKPSCKRAHRRGKPCVLCCAPVPGAPHNISFFHSQDVPLNRPEGQSQGKFILNIRNNFFTEMVRH